LTIICDYPIIVIMNLRGFFVAASLGLIERIVEADPASVEGQKNLKKLEATLVIGVCGVADPEGTMRRIEEMSGNINRETEQR
jgi:hypothetical protein